MIRGNSPAIVSCTRFVFPLWTTGSWAASFLKYSTAFSLPSLFAASITLGFDPACAAGAKSTKMPPTRKIFALTNRLISGSDCNVRCLLVSHIRAAVKPVEKAAPFQIVHKTEIHDVLRLGAGRFRVPGRLHLKCIVQALKRRMEILFEEFRVRIP